MSYGEEEPSSSESAEVQPNSYRLDDLGIVEALGQFLCSASDILPGWGSAG